MFFIATWDAWVMPLITSMLYITGLSDLDIFQASHTNFLWNTTITDIFIANLITEPGYYYIYIYLLAGELDALYVSGWGKPVIFLNIFHIVSFAIFLSLLSSSAVSRKGKYLYGLLGVGVYYGIGFLTQFIYLFSILVIEYFFE